MTTPSDRSLKLAIAEMLPEVIERNLAGDLFLWKSSYSPTVTTHEWFALVAMCEVDLNNEREDDGRETERDRYMHILQDVTDAPPTHPDDYEWAYVTAPWRARALALCKTKGIEVE